MKLAKLSFFIFLLSFSSCDESSDAPNSEDPSNLEIDIAIVENTKSITVSATASNAIEYEFDLGDGSDLISNASGTLEHTYIDEGTYTVVVKAFGSSGRFLRDSRSVQIGSTELGPIDDTGFSTPLSYEGMTLIWQDEFEGSVLNSNDWKYEIGTGSNGWGNNELQFYQEENTTLTEGYLVIEARRESISNSSYTSSRIITEDRVEFQYGRVDIRAILPKGKGIWPALWMLGANFRQVSWPYCGEIDIMEMIGGEGNEDEVHGTIHWWNEDSGLKNDTGGSTRLSSGIFNDEFHVFSIVWDENQIRWLLDNRQYYVVNTTPSHLDEFRNEFFFIFNVAVGGNWPGNPDPTIFPQRMIVDYVRVFQFN